MEFSQKEYLQKLCFHYYEDMRNAKGKRRCISQGQSNTSLNNVSQEVKQQSDSTTQVLQYGKPYVRFNVENNNNTQSLTS